MFFFKENLNPCCSNCHYATEYIPKYSFPHSNPYCSKGHGKCGVDKLCGDYRLINSHYCCECKFFKSDYDYEGQIVDYCCKHEKIVYGNDDACVYFELEELRNE